MCMVKEQKDRVNVSKEDFKDTIFVSEHAFDRMKERNGWNRKAAIRMVKKIYDNGLRPNEAGGKAKKYMKNRAEHNPEDDIALYGEYIYIFRDNTLITAFSINSVLSGNKKAVA